MSPEQREALQWAVKVLDEVMEGDEPQATIRAMLTAPAASTPPEGKVREFTFEDAKRIVRGAVEVYGGGYSGAEREAFQNGIRTAFNCLDGARMDDTQTGANYRIGEQALAAPAPACKNPRCEDGRIYEMRHTCWGSTRDYFKPWKPCPDCNAGEGEKP